MTVNQNEPGTISSSASMQPPAIAPLASKPAKVEKPFIPHHSLLIASLLIPHHSLLIAFFLIPGIGRCPHFLSSAQSLQQHANKSHDIRLDIIIGSAMHKFRDSSGTRAILV